MKFRRIEPQEGQESVWDYPRPPRLEQSDKVIQVIFNGVMIAETRRAFRVLETSHPPVYYLPPDDIKMEHLTRTNGSSFCEWKGQAAYYTISVSHKTVTNAAWFYPQPTPAFAPIKNYVAFYPSLMDACYVDGERVQAQEGDFYGGWITRNIVGPFKGGAGTWDW
jgi:uncharacterized protein (DUF427 family)